MQRPNYGQSPPIPLHHPVPQHVSTVPQLRSPPPPTSSQPQAAGYGNPYQQGHAGHAGQAGQAGPAGQAQGSTPMNNMFGQYGNFIQDPTAQFAAAMGQNAFRQGQQILEQNTKRWFNFGSLKHYFNVSNSYVVNKLFLVLFPWRHGPWSRRQAVGPNGQEGWHLPPRDDINSPDMYIPIMALVTYVLLSTTLAGLRGQFQPELLTSKASTAAIVTAFEMGILLIAFYLLSIPNDSKLDLVAYSGYKFVGVIVTVVIAELVNGGKGTGGWVGWSVFLYTWLASSLFLGAGDAQRPMQVGSRGMRNQRTYFLFGYSYLLNLVLFWYLCRG